MLQYAIEHKVELIAIMGQIVMVASAISALTPTPKDDSFMKKVIKVVDMFALNVGNAK